MFIIKSASLIRLLLFLSLLCFLVLFQDSPKINNATRITDVHIDLALSLPRNNLDLTHLHDLITEFGYGIMKSLRRLDW